jgi:hypothetical protein
MKPRGHLATTVAVGVLLCVWACSDARSVPPSATPDSAPLQQKIVELSRLIPLNAAEGGSILGVYVGTENKVTRARSEWSLGSTPLIAGGEILKMGRHMNITFQPEPALQLTFEDVARHFMNVPFALSAQMTHGADSDARASTIGRVLHVFRVLAGELRVELGPGSASIPDTRRVVSITVSDNLYRAWATTQTLRDWRAQKR